MTEVQTLHRNAMALADNATEARYSHDATRYIDLLRRAFQLERTAAEFYAYTSNAEPSRSVLLRSAATLAMQCGERDESLRLVKLAFAGQPTDDLREELVSLEHQLVEGNGSLDNGIIAGRSQIYSRVREDILAAQQCVRFMTPTTTWGRYSTGLQVVEETIRD